MTPLTLPPGERGKVRVFAISLPPDDLAAMDEAARLGWLRGALGADELAPGATIFAVTDLQDVGLLGYLRDGQGIDGAALAPDRAKLTALEGWVAVIPSSALAGAGSTLTLAPELTLIGTYAEDAPDWTGPPIETPSAAPYSAPPTAQKPPMSDARIGGMVATAVLLFLAIFVVIFVWLSG